ncbi:hypothetical protein Dimus_033733, partial [Dionaea muscipula]
LPMHGNSSPCVSIKLLARERDRHTAGCVGARLSCLRGGDTGAPLLAAFSCSRRRCSLPAVPLLAARGATARCPHMEMSVERRCSPMLVVVLLIKVLPAKPDVVIATAR